MFYAYLLGFDLLNAIGHCNFEFIPSSLYLVSSFPSHAAAAAAACANHVHAALMHTTSGSPRSLQRCRSPGLSNVMARSEAF